MNQWQRYDFSFEKQKKMSFPLVFYSLFRIFAVEMAMIVVENINNVTNRQGCDCKK